MDFFLSVIGMVMIIEGIPYFASPDRMKTVMKIVQAQPDNTLRIFGAILMGLGLMLVFVARNSSSF